MRNRPLRSAGQTAVDAACLLGVLAVVLWPQVEVYGGTAAVPAIVGGLLLGGGVAVLSAARGWSPLAVVAVVVVVYFAAGGPLAAPSTTVAGVLPTLDTLETLLRGVGSSWQQMLTLQPPVGSSGGLLVAPYLLALVGSVAALGIALRARRGGAAAIVVPVVVAGVVALLGTRRPSIPPMTTGVVLLLVLLPWAAWRAGTLRLRRVLSLTVLTAVGLGGSLLGAPAVVGETPRLVVRDEIVPPFDPRAYPSPLAAFRDYVKREKDTKLFTVTGLPAGATIRLATMDRYDGVVWNVAGNGTAESSGEFRRVGETIPSNARGSAAHVEMTIDKLSGVWLPTVGEATSIDIADSAAAEGLRFNEATGAAVLTGALRPGLSYALDVVVPRDPTDTQVGRAETEDVSQPPTNVPDVVAVTAADVARDAGTPVQVARTLQQWLSEKGYFSHGATDANQVQSLSGHGANRMVSLLDGDIMVGDGEQYAAAMALMARAMGLPARVVLGFVPHAASDGSVPQGEPVTVTGDDLEAWVEIPFVGYGWVPFYPTPPREQTPEQNEKPNPSDPQPQVVQPPPPPPDAVKPPDDDTEQPGTKTPPSDQSDGSLWSTIAKVGGVVSVPLAILALPFLVIGAVKARRRRRRRRDRDVARRVAGGWDEVLDAAVDLRQPVLAHATRAESARSLATAFSAAGDVHQLASAADRAVFSAHRPTPAEAAAYWADVETAVRGMRRAVGWRRRTWARLSLASLRGRHRPRRSRP
ncbi:transglutaminase-like domain-containing protein [Cellulomonas edaphi]|uniref:Transglutaminase-like domain-containing protein n=1 Tax=Cellulomonas edaphi TaxID=3053468 RepID=A0ABT7S7D5_9CELL|nr:transglutaminase-like domain-containing protein [Cellulomons edaphi]MDM7831538.1 transglutaminase-like domain-containing protein [Cellulomons edaphi]